MALWKHQEIALEMMENRTDQFFGLFFDMSTGKSRIALEWIARRKYVRVLMLGTTNSLNVWQDEIAKHQYDFDIVDFRGLSSKARVTLLNATAPIKTTLYLINYEALSKQEFSSVLIKYQFDIVIADEAHRLKAHDSIMSKVAAIIPAKYRLAMTGTPSSNNLLDIYGIARFLAPEYRQHKKRRYLVSKHFGTWTEFKNRYALWVHMYVRIGYQNVEELAQIRDTFSYVVRVRDVHDLPPEQHIIKHVELEPSAKKQYKELERDFVTEVGGQQITVENVLGKILRLQQLTGGYLTDQQVSTAKITVLEEMLEELGDNPVVVFYRFNSDLHQLIQLANNVKKSYLQINGTINQYRDWQHTKANLVFVQMGAGSEGIDLTRAAYAVYYSLDWSANKYEQSKARLARVNQLAETVTYYYLIVPKTIDQDILDALKEKQTDVHSLFLKLKNRWSN